MTRPPETPDDAELADLPDDEADPGGPFRSWGALYATVIVWALTVVVLLWLFTLFLNVDPVPP